MGDPNQLIYLKHVMPKVEGPVLEVGSKEYGSTTSFRGFYAGAEYIGVDMAEGSGVDVVVDLTESIGTLREGHFALAICCSVLEHARKPWLFADNLTRLLRPGGRLYISVPWVWRYHPYPDDYFRFSQRGVRSLFEEFTWSNVCYTTNVAGEFFDIPEEDPGVDDQMRMVWSTPEGRKRVYLPYLMVNMLGTRSSR
jgi:SAM-dependent methyltransferase